MAAVNASRSLTTLARCLLALALSLAAVAAPAAPVEWLPAPVARQPRAAGVAPRHAALVVQEVGSPLPRVSVNAQAPMSPASVMKLVTTYAALDMLVPAYTWRTQVLAAGPVADGVLAGNLVLRGAGDPKLTLDRFWLLLRQIRARGVRDVRGDLVLDRSAFALPAYASGAFDNEPLAAYHAGPDALLLNFQSIRLEFAPDEARQAVSVYAEPVPADLDIVNLVKLGDGPCGEWKDGVRADLVRAAPALRLVLSGVYPRSCGLRHRHIAPPDHQAYLLGVFRRLWGELGGTLDGGVRDASASADARLLAQTESPPLAEVVRDINKFSNNVMARQVLLTLGLELGARPATSADGARAIESWLLRKGWRFPELVIDNGSGLSRSERISAEHLSVLLLDALRGPLMPEFVSSLPLAAVDGTMRKRLVDQAGAGAAHIKTGSLEGVRTIAGYVLDRSGRYQVVVFMVNDPNAAAARGAQDALLECV